MKIYLLFCTGPSHIYQDAYEKAMAFDDQVDDHITLAQISETCPIWCAAVSLDEILGFFQWKAEMDDEIWGKGCLKKAEKILKDTRLSEGNKIDQINQLIPDIHLTWIESGEEI